MEITKAVETDLDSLMELFDFVKEHLMQDEIYQWDSRYPNRNIVHEDIEKDYLYGIIQDSQYIGAIAINELQEAEYLTLNWDDTQGKSLCVHRLVVHPKNQGKGIGKKLLLFAEETAFNNGYSSIRLDAYSGNPIALSLYERNGYRRKGEIYFPRRELPFICYEKLIRNVVK
jgi:ribosomal protein S18 acetylase RimI-like enzyme